MSFFKSDQLSYGNFAFEVQFLSKLILLERENLSNFSKELDSRFTMQDYNDTEIKYSGGKDVQAKIELNKIVVVCGNCAITSFADYAKSFVTLAIEKFGFANPIRIGCRITAISKRKSLQEAASEYFNLLSLKKENVDKVGTIMGYKIGTTIRMSDNIICNITLNPAVRRNIVINLKTSKQTDEFGVMVDVDIFCEQNVAAKMKINDFIDIATRNLRDKVYPLIETVR